MFSGDVRPPNITGEFGYYRNDSSNYRYGSGAFSTLDSSSGNGYSGRDNTSAFKWTFYASRTSSLYGASTTVQAPALIVLTVIKS